MAWKAQNYEKKIKRDWKTENEIMFVIKKDTPYLLHYNPMLVIFQSTFKELFTYQKLLKCNP